MTKYIRTHKLISFFGLTFLITWGMPGIYIILANILPSLHINLDMYSPIYYLAVWSPALSAIIMVIICYGGRGLKEYFSQLFKWRVDAKWYLSILIGLPLLNLTACIITVGLGKEAIASEWMDWQEFFMSSILILSAGPIEEFGWRGYALPLLRKKYNLFISAILLGVTWAVWHFPLIFLSSQTIIVDTAGYLLACTLITIIMSFIYIKSGGSLLLMILFHWMINLTYPWEGSADIGNIQLLLWIIIAISLLFIFMDEYTRKRNIKDLWIS